jgi:3,4-dihydroxy 2-butanone 4-phosphate synthase/GTP cyclohydrolase II
MDPNTGYGLGAQILRDLGIQKMTLLSNSDLTFKGIGNYGLEIVDRQPLPFMEALP